MNRSIRGALPARTHATRASKGGEGGFVPGLLAGLIAYLAAATLSLVLCALIAYKSSDPDALIAPLGFACLVLTCLAGGLGVGLRCGSAVLPCALLCGCIFVGAGLFLSLFFGADTRQTLTLGLGLGASLCLRAGIIVLTCVSSVLTAQVKSKLHARPRHR